MKSGVEDAFSQHKPAMIALADPPADTVIATVGEKAYADFLRKMALHPMNAGRERLMENSRPEIYVLGDARRDLAMAAEAITDAAAARRAIFSNV